MENCDDSKIVEKCVSHEKLYDDKDNEERLKSLS